MVSGLLVMEDRREILNPKLDKKRQESGEISNSATDTRFQNLLILLSRIGSEVTI